MTMGDWNWLETTEKLQVEAYGNDLRNMTGKSRDFHVAMNVLAALDELHETLGENPSWKPWANEVGVMDREAFIGELVDVQHFIANLLLLANASEEEFWTRYQEKQERNRARQAKSGGYSTVKEKCPKCKRELDKPGAYKWLAQEYIQATEKSDVVRNQLQCSGCQEVFPYEHKIGESLPGQA